MDLYLRNGTGYYINYSIEMNDEEMIAQRLPAGDYTLELVPFTVGSDADNDEVKYECQFIEMEIAVSTVEITHNRLRSYGSPNVRLPGPFDFSPVSQGRPLNYSTLYDSNPSAFGIPFKEINASTWFRVVQQIPFELNPKAGSNPIFRFSSSLGYNFLTAGNFRLLLEPQPNVTTLTPSCIYSDEECLSGRNQEANLNVITTTLNSGKYVLWIVEITDRRLPYELGHLPSPDPISFSLYVHQLHSDETFVSCDALPLPKTMNSPGLIDDTGYLSFREYVLLDLTKREESFTFRVPSDFLFRAWSEAHRIDIDFEIKNPQGTILARTYRPMGQEESAALELQAQIEYTFTIKYYSNFASIFCEKILMELMIQPLSPEYRFDYCTGHNTFVPAFPAMNNIGSTVRMPTQSYYYNWAQTHTEIISRVEITPSADMRLNANLNSHFLDGLSLMLRAVNTTARQPTSYSYPGGRRLSLVLAAHRTFILSIQGGPHQYLANMSAFSPCAFFDFNMDLTPVHTNAPTGLTPIIRRCPNFLPPLPTSLVGPRYFGTSNRVHFQEQFRFPAANGFEAHHEFTFTVRRRSLFRAYTEPRKGNDVDIDFGLTENGTPVPHVIKEFDEEKITFVLQPQRTYVFKMSFFTDFARLDPCAYFNLEFEIAPIHDLPATACTTVLPKPGEPLRFINLLAEFYSSRTYAWEQSNHSLLIAIPLIVQTRGPVFARFIVSYDFVWSDLSIRVLNNDDGSLVALGENAFNKNEILGLQLVTGNYTVEIFEPQPLEAEELHHCTDFVFSYGVAPSPSEMFPDNSVITEDDTDPSCMKLYLPSTLNSISHLSVVSGETFHTSSFVRVHNEYNSELVRFDLAQTSVVRVYIPPYDKFDVDVILYSVAAGGVRTTISKSIKYHDEEIIYETLRVGSYGFEFKFYFRPNNTPCLIFPIEFGIAPVSYINQFIHLEPSVCTPQSTSLNPFRPNVEMNQAMKRITSTKEFQTSTTFNLTEASLFTARLDYSFFVGHMSLSLEGTNIRTPFLSSPSTRTIPGYIAQDVAFFDNVLYPGSYRLVLEDSTNYTTAECTLFNLQYQLSLGLVPETYCDDADRLPSDVFSWRGRSRFYGGPQKEDGTLHLSGKHFILPDVRSHSDIEFYVRKPSFVRIWAKFEEPTKNDIDFLLWQNNTKTSLVSASAGMEAIESHSIFLEPQTSPYVLDIFVFNRAVLECNYLHFEFVIEPNASVIADMVCPDPLPSPPLPPQTITISGPEFVFYGEQFVFTSQYLSTHKTTHWLYDQVTYDMNITVDDGSAYELSVALGYNFLWSDFSIDLYRFGLKKAGSTGDIALSTDSWDDFRSLLDAALEPRSQYLLRITEKIYSKDQKKNIAGTCEKFSFSMLATRVGDNQDQFRITSVSPPTGRDLSVDTYLRLEIAFSQPIGTANSHMHDLTEWLARDGVVYMRSYFTNVYPLYASWNPQTTVLTVSFSNLQLGRTYSLFIKASSFVSRAGVVSANYTQIHTYSTMSCDCGGRGVCATNQTRAGCICDWPYAGPDCRSCTVGFHRVGTECHSNTQCTNDTCNHHGTCSDTQGYPVCLCDPAYESTGQANGECGKCHQGFSGYPTCKKDSDERDLHCEAPLLPNNLNTVAYLKVDGYMHLQGDYYIDVNHYGHDMFFRIEEESYFRVYTEPHEVDIDLWLFKEQDNGRSDVVAYSIAYNDEETLFRKLPAGNYRLNFQFLLFRDGYTSCPTFNLALAVAHVHDFGFAVDKYKNDCGDHNVSPDIPMPSSTVPLEAWSFAPNKTFVVGSLGTDVEARTFLDYRFKVPKVPHKIAILQMELGYRFLTGDIAAKLLKIGAKDEKPTVVGYGYNGYNQHYLRQKLEPGDYSLILYLPAPVNRTISPCSLYTFKINTYFDLQDEDVFNCPFSELPESLDSITLRGENGHVVINDHFLIEEWNDKVEFTVNSPSVIRAIATSSVPVSYTLERKAGSNWISVQAAGEKGELFYDHLVSTEEYRLSFNFFYIDVLHFCPTLNLVLSIMSTTYAIPVVQCSEGNAATLPPIPTGHLTLPFLYNGLEGGFEKEFVAYPSFGSVVGQWTISWTDNVALEIRLGSDFLASNMHLELTPPNRQTIRSTTNMNEEFLIAELNPGAYTLTLLQGNRTSISAACSKFSFFMSVQSLNQWKRDPCNALGLLELPDNLSHLRYAGEREEIKLFSDNWKIPAAVNESLILTRRIYFNVTRESLMRLYIGPHVIDIDVALYRTVDPLTSVARGADLLGEESFVTVIPAGQYFIRLIFWGNDAEKPTCMQFNMEIVISPTATLPVRKTHCNSDGSAPESWPTIPPRITDKILPWQHSYNGFYQQIDHHQLNHSIKTFDVAFMTTVDLHIELGYNFLLGDLVISLTDSTGTTLYGENKPTRNILNAKALPTGMYQISIYEAAQNDETQISCSDFTLSILVDKTSTSDARSMVKGPAFPTDLNTIEYLKYSDEMHIQDPHYVMRLSPITHVAPKLTFTLRKQSVVRVSIGDLDPMKISLDNSIEQSKEIWTVLPVGNHNISFFLTDFRYSVFVAVNFQMAIMPVTDFQIYANGICAVREELWVPPKIVVRPTDGLYQYSSSAARYNDLGTGISLPFEVTRESIVSVQISFQYIIAHIDVGLVDSFSKRVGIDDWNMNDLNALVLPGKFNITIIPSALPWPTGVTRAACGEFAIRISISPKGSGADRVDCSSAALFPWDLNSPLGGSSEFGGPMLSGSLKMWGQDFLANGENGELTAKFTISEESLVSVFLHQHSWSQMTVSLTDSATQRPVRLASRHRNYFQSSSLYYTYAPGNNPHDYLLKLTYRPTEVQACSTFTFGIAIQPVVEIKDYLTAQCSGIVPQQQLPKKITTSPIEVSSYFTSRDIANNVQFNSTVFAYEMEFSIKQNSALDVTLQYNPLINSFTLTLFTRPNATAPYRRVTGGTWEPVDGPQAGLTLIIDYNLDIKRGTDYKLTIAQPNLTHWINQQYCFPYHFLFQLENIAAGGNNFVRYVEPGGGDHFDPKREIWVEVRFSSALYDSAGKALTRTSESQTYIMSSVHLQETSSGQLIFPYKVSPPEDNPNPDDYTRVLLQFPHDQFVYGGAYKLTLVARKLYGVDKSEIQMRTNHTYVMSPFNEACSGNGHYNGKKCICDEGTHFTGDNCDKCEAGFNLEAGKCVRPNGCAVDTCGCSIQSTPSHCISVGNCSSAAGTVSCHCPDNYAGNRCEKCATGFADISKGCIKDCTPPCGDHGVCNPETNTCKCNGNFDGKGCNECKPGWMGASCNAQGSSSLFKVIGIIVAAIICILIVAFAAWYWRMRQGSEYVQLTHGDDDDGGLSLRNAEELGNFGSSDSGSGSGEDAPDVDAKEIELSPTDSDD